MTGVVLAVLIAALFAVVLGLGALHVLLRTPARHTHRAVAAHRARVQLRSHR